MSSDQLWMRRALALALRSAGRTWPNPGVGCVLVRQGRLIGRGRHERCGGPHAEVQALHDCRTRGGDPRGATAYVTLAPCTRQGRTGPCVQALVAAGVARVVAAVSDPVQDDPGPLLLAAGIGYATGCEDALARFLHGGFLSRVVRSRPRVTGKWAMSLDGCLAAGSGHSAWISSGPARALSRRRRRLYDAILVGAGTAAADDPELLAAQAGRDPVRIVVSAGAQLRNDGRLLRSIARAPLWLVHGPDADAVRMHELAQAGVRLLRCAAPHDPQVVLTLLGQEGINDLLVEGGAQVHGAWLRAGVYDRLECWQGGVSLGGGLPVAQGPGVDRIDAGRRWRLETAPRVLDECVWTCWAAQVNASPDRRQALGGA